MKLVTFVENGTSRVGVLRTQNGQDSVVDLSTTVSGVPTDMIGLLQAGGSALAKIRDALAKSPAGRPLSEVKLKAPVPRPGKIICIGLNYSDHAAETGQAIPAFPVVFAKYENTVIADGESIVLPQVSSQVDYEAELGFVIGRKGRYISEADALSYVAGYLPVNDVSARDFQNRTSQWTMGKTFDTFAPMGPAITTADEIRDPHNLNIRLSIGSEVLQNSNTRNLIFGIPKLVASLSEVITLEPGDIVSTGTPPGVGSARKPQRWLRPGDVVRIEIEGVGVLSNPVVAES